MKSQFDSIIITSDEPYSDTWHTQLIYAEFLSKQLPVLFINPPQKWKLKNVIQFSQNEQKINEGLTVIEYVNVFPAFFPFLFLVNEWLNQTLIKKRLQQKKTQSVLIWHFDSFRNSFNSKSFTNNFKIKRIYHVIDPFMKNPKNDLLALLADKIVITSPRNNQYYSSYANKVLNIPQVIDVKLNKDLLAGSLNTNVQLPPNFFVLLGTISDDLDFECLEECANIPQVNLVIIGKTIKLEKYDSTFNALINRSNVQYLGQMPPEKFYPIIAKATAGLVLYNNKRKNQASSPLKVINYLTANIPTLSNINCEIEVLTDTCIYTTNDVQKFKSFVSLAMENKLPFNTLAADSYLASISLDNAVNKILSAI